MATIQAKLASSERDGEVGVDGRELRKEVDNLRTARRLLEQTVLDANRLLSEKAEELRTLQDELQSAKDQINRYQVSIFLNYSLVFVLIHFLFVFCFFFCKFVIFK